MAAQFEGVLEVVAMSFTFLSLGVLLVSIFLAYSLGLIILAFLCSRLLRSVKLKKLWRESRYIKWILLFLAILWYVSLMSLFPYIGFVGYLTDSGTEMLFSLGSMLFIFAWIACIPGIFILVLSLALSKKYKTLRRYRLGVVCALVILLLFSGVPFILSRSADEKAYELEVKSRDNVIAAVEAYRRDAGRLPDNLSVITPGYLSCIPQMGFHMPMQYNLIEWDYNHSIQNYTEMIDNRMPVEPYYRLSYGKGWLIICTYDSSEKQWWCDD